MGNFEFSILLLKNIYLYIIILFLVFILYIPIIKKFSNSIIDPMFMCILSVILADAIPFFLFFTGNCKSQYLFYFILVEIFYWLSLLLTYNKDATFAIKHIKNEDFLVKRLFYLSIILFFSINIYIYSFVGIPLFMDSRFELFKNSLPGLGILNRVSNFSSYFIIFYSFHRIISMKQNKYVFYIFSIIVVDFLSASRGSILTICFVYFIYFFFFLKKKPKLKKKYIPVLLAFPILIGLFYKGSSANGGGLINGTVSLLFRFVAYGDIYWYAYPNQMIDYVSKDTTLLGFFSGILRPFRIISDGQAGIPIGTSLLWNVAPYMKGTFAGPNGRLPICMWAYFGWFGILVSIILGYISSFVLGNLKKHLGDSILGIAIYGYLYLTILNIPSDPTVFIDCITTIIICYIIYFISILKNSNFVITIKRKKRL